MTTDEIAVPTVLPAPIIMVVESDEAYRGVTRTVLEREGYEVMAARDGEEALLMLRKWPVDVMILDYVLPGLRVNEVMDRLRARRKTARLPVLVVASDRKGEAHVKALDMGADDFLTKPFESKILLAHIRSLVRLKRLNDETENFENVVAAMISAVEAKDPYTRGHSERVSRIGELLSRELDLDDRTQTLIRRAGLVHDIGKLVVDLSFINKKGKLDDAEWAIMKSHPEAGARICAPLRSALQIIPLVRHHHEKLNGMGYPDGLVEDQIPLPVRIISVADVYDALTTDRPYRKAMTHTKAMEILEREVTEGCWDPDVVGVLSGLGPGTLGTKVTGPHDAVTGD